MFTKHKLKNAKIDLLKKLFIETERLFNKAKYKLENKEELKGYYECIFDVYKLYEDSLKGDK